MHNPVTAMTEKVAHTMKSMVYLAMRVSYRRGATVAELSGFLNDWMPSGGSHPHWVVEIALQDLHRNGKVTQAGARWYPAGVA